MIKAFYKDKAFNILKITREGKCHGYYPDSLRCDTWSLFELRLDEKQATHFDAKWESERHTGWE